MSYPVPLKSAQAEIEIKKSRFIAFADYVASREAAMKRLAELKTEFPDARHHCWAYLLGDPNCASNAGMGDDGEPSGTAGKPILNVLQHKGVGDVFIGVVRYFGGIKLGAGGLTRAYGQAAQAVMAELEIKSFEALVSLELSCDFALEQFIRHHLDLMKGQITQIDYSDRVTLKLSLPEAHQDELTRLLVAHGVVFKINHRDVK
ncbi:YigZ family protein [Thiomicrospira microaerophila]|uniref:YigZ family protein n=1 Tax=Thiomicrospira microaerophila TaxID=406020 RepID=UPI00200DF2EA|nr:YigZ family protein [Thiomicrospira microaerophila]UQB43194.1 YigZ family protein [Thiomicrospira microaerophila]